ncbi:YciI family protein [Planctomonas psychrotolerans]|uniref:YciI family protein n=1 Tax=Planctomonas psychrotolerans TaxID=2528712 RepID=UPI00123B23E4|nr:YciI family protein [Planctomonas psychrotolerans]
MAHFAVLIYADDSAHTPDATSEDLRTSDRHAQALDESGSLRSAYALTPRAMATSIRADGVSDGPFHEAQEIVVGFYILEAPDLDAALAIARTTPAIRGGGGVEVRPVHSGGTVAR